MNTIIKKNISAYFNFEVTQKKKHGYIEFRLKHKWSRGENKIFDDLFKSKEIIYFQPPEEKHSDPDGYFGGSLQYQSVQYGLSLIRFESNVQAYHLGYVNCSIQNNDCMLFKKLNNNAFEIFIINEEYDNRRQLFVLLDEGALEPNIRSFLNGKVSAHVTIDGDEDLPF